MGYDIYFYNKTIPALQGLGDLEDVVIVFFCLIIRWLRGTDGF